MRERFHAEVVPLAWEVIHEQLQEREGHARAGEKPHKRAAQSAETNGRIASTNHEKPSGKRHEKTKTRR
jgi:hypothetical protein